MAAIENFTGQTQVWLSIAAICPPLCAFLLCLIVKRFAAFWSVLAISVSFVASVLLFINFWNQAPAHYAINWISFQSFEINIGFLLNNLSVVMLLLISFIALLVNIYSIKYMQGDQHFPRYFSYLSLFCFSMLSLVIANNLFLIYIFWELVGFSSYLLIGFWYTRPAAVLANKKAFIMNRLGDLGFLAGIMIVLTQFHTLDLETLFGQTNLINSSFIQNGLWVSPFGTMPDYWLTIAGLCFFAGAAAKSAQFPLHTWLPDAMEGPTAVSSLIHAATMVAAGVFLLLRINPLFNDTVLIVIASIGAFTAFMAATIAITQNDIKRVLAFSTVSQLGFMMLAIGVGDGGAAIFHLITHAFFKCLLFLGAGIVIHEMHHLKEKHALNFDQQDMHFMGGLRKAMPVTAAVFIIASMALAGLPFTSGYLSKDAILVSVFEWADLRGGIYWLFPLVISITSWLTAFYIFRVVFKVFFGTFRLPEILKLQMPGRLLHEAPALMKFPVIILAIFCFGFIYALNPINLDSSWLYHAFHLQTHNEGKYHIFIPLYINVMSIALIAIAYLIYGKKKIKLNMEHTRIYAFSYHQWYFNELYQKIIVTPLLFKSRIFYAFDQKVVDGIVNSSAKVILVLSQISNWIDVKIVDGLVNFTALVVDRLGIWFRSVHNGKVQHYVVWMLLVFLTFFIFQMIF